MPGSVLLEKDLTDEASAARLGLGALVSRELVLPLASLLLGSILGACSEWDMIFKVLHYLLLYQNQQLDLSQTTSRTSESTVMREQPTIQTRNFACRATVMCPLGPVSNVETAEHVELERFCM